MREKLFELARRLEAPAWDTLDKIGTDIRYLAEFGNGEDVNEFRKIIQNFVKENYS